MKNFKNNNKGFSLVELIVVIAIMVVLAVALAPVFTKFVEQARRATDISNATAIAEAVLVDVADGKDFGSGKVAVDATTGKPSTIKSNPTAQGNAIKKGGAFSFKYVSGSNTVEVYINDVETINLVDPTVAQAYKDYTGAAEGFTGTN